MTRFIGEAVGQRSGGAKGRQPQTCGRKWRVSILPSPCPVLLGWFDKALCFADFQKTGRHGELEQAAAAERVPALPERDQNRPHIFMDLRHNNKTLGTGQQLT